MYAPEGIMNVIVTIDVPWTRRRKHFLKKQEYIMPEVEVGTVEM